MQFTQGLITLRRWKIQGDGLRGDRQPRGVLLQPGQMIECNGSRGGIAYEKWQACPLSLLRRF
jgi:hypothetical protein